MMDKSAKYLAVAGWIAAVLTVGPSFDASAQSVKSKAASPAGKSSAPKAESASDDEELETPPAFAPFEHLVGGWNGTEIPAANKLKGAVVKHNWAWTFRDGKAIGMSVQFENSKVLSKADLSYEEKSKTFRLIGTGGDGKPVNYAGALDKGGKTLPLKRSGLNANSAEETLTLRILPDNKIRYAVWLDEKKKDALRPVRSFEIGLTKAGEAFASASAAANLPKCIITGGAAAMTVSFQGRSFPVCCTGCQSQFNESPEKYVARADAVAASSKGSESIAKMAKGKGEGEFDSKKAGSDEDGGKAAANARTWLRLAQAFERQNNTKSALTYYQRILKESPNAPQAKIAAERVKALSDR